MDSPIRPRELPGRAVFQSLQRFEWRYQTLSEDLSDLNEVNVPKPGDTVSQHRYTVRSGLYAAERKLHHFLSGYYTFKSLVTTLAQSSPDREFEGRVKDRRDEFAQLETSRIILGLRHYVQHQNILPLLIKISSLSTGGPWYVINKRELRKDDFEYREPQMIRDVEEYEDWFDYYFAGVENVCIYPFHVIQKNWEHVEYLREDIYDLARELLRDEIDEYIAQLNELTEVRDDLREEHRIFQEMLDQEVDLTPELRELLEPGIYDRLVED